MLALDRKLLRDLKQLSGPGFAIALVMACGVSTLVMSRTASESLSRAKKVYYDRYAFADVFSRLKRAPVSLEERISEIPGVSRLETRLVFDVTLDIDGMSEPAVGRLISLPARRQPYLNRLHLRSGVWPDPEQGEQVLVSEAFAQANSFEPGDSLSALINGRYQRLVIVGLALSPEFVYESQGTELVPDNKHFGVLWMNEEELAAAFDMTGAFNDVCLRLMRGASEPEVLRRLDDLLYPYGGQVSYGRENHYSHRRVSDELQQLGTMSFIWPAIFLLVSAFLFHVVISRLIGLQREQIALLKSFGYSRLQIGLHYCKLISVIVLVATMMGTGGGAWLGYGLTRIYTQFFRLPVFDYKMDTGVVLIALAVSGGAAFLGAWGALRRAMDLPPAEAMRPEVPPAFGPTMVERAGLGRYLAQTTRMILRQIERRPLRSLLTILGIASATAVLTLGNCMSDSVDFVIDFQYFRSQRHDAVVAFTEPASHRALHELSHLPGVLRAEPFRSLRVRLSNGHISRRQGLTCLAASRDLVKLINADLQEVALPAKGILLSKQLADLLRLQQGESVRVEVLEGSRPAADVVVTGIIEDFGGMSAYMDIEAANQLMKESDVLSGGFLEVDPERLSDLYSRVKMSPGISSLTLRRTSLRLLRELMEELLLRMQAIYAVFAGVIAFGIIYNSARISLAERNRELASLRVLGFTRAEISAILLGEVGLLTILALPAGLVMGNALVRLAVAMLQTETQRFPYVVETATYAYAVAVTLVAALLSGLVVRRRVDHLDLVAALKTRE